MSDAITLIQAVIRDQLRGFKTAELGVVTKVYSHESSSDKNNYQCDVKLRDSGLELKRVNVATQRMGAVAIPNQDDLVLVQYLNGDIHSAIVTGRLYNDAVRPPGSRRASSFTSRPIARSRAHAASTWSCRKITN